MASPFQRHLATDDDDDDEENDFFTRLSSKDRKRKLPAEASSSTTTTTKNEPVQATTPVNRKRHHGVSSIARKQQMDAILLELQTESTKISSKKKKTPESSSTPPDKPKSKQRLSPTDQATFHQLFRVQLCCSRESIVQAMAFCFDHSEAAEHISSLLRDLLIDLPDHTSTDTISARLFLVSDILYNSQQPGIHNAFLYRQTIRDIMTGDVLGRMGAFARRSFGRMGQNRIQSALSGVLAAWINWGVFDAVFIDQLEARFQGRNVERSTPRRESAAPTKNVTLDSVHTSQSTLESPTAEATVRTEAQGGWFDVGPEEETPEVPSDDPAQSTESLPSTHEIDPENLKHNRPQSDKSLNIKDEAWQVQISPDPELDGESLEPDDLDADLLRLLGPIVTKPGSRSNADSNATPPVAAPTECYESVDAVVDDLDGESLTESDIEGMDLDDYRIRPFIVV